jgi:formylglycine-generating enzyme required for sulfatase activity/serine/threonine protein kinase
MAGLNINAALGIADDEHVIWSATRAAIERMGFQIKRAPGLPTAKLGQGAFATVFYAEHRLNKRPAAIKVFHSETPDLVESFKNEAKTVEAPEFPRQFAAETYLSHHEPGIQPFLVLEYVRGKPLDEYVVDNKPSRDVRIELLEQLLSGVQALHERNITHRDLSAGNVLVDQRGRVRLLDFGEAGEIVRGTQHTTLRNPLGNRGYSPGEQIRGEKRAGPEDDIFNCAMLAVHVLTGRSPPPNETRSGDPQHVAACRRQLREAGIPGSLSRIVASGLRDPQQRVRLAGKMAADLFDQRVRRPQRQRTAAICLVMTAVFLLVAVGFWWRHDETQRALAHSEYHRLKRQTADILYGSDPAVARRLDEIRQLEDEWNSQSVRGERFEADRTLDRILDGLQEVIRINAGLERSHPRREALGTALQAMRWVEQSPRIMDRKRAAEAAYKETGDLLARGVAEAAWTRLDGLQQELAELTRENALAERAAEVQRQYALLDQNVSDRLRGLESHRPVAELAEHGREAWQAGDWTLAQRDYGQARQRLEELLVKEETADERAARKKANVEALQLAEAEKQRLQSEIDRLTAGRDQDASRAKDLETQLAKLQQQSQADRDELARTQDRLKSETALRTAAEQAAKEYVTTIAQLARASRPRDEPQPPREGNASPVASSTAKTAGLVRVPAGPREVWRNSLGMTFVLIPAGQYERGAGPGESDASADERPRHLVRISRDFLVGQHEVTQSQYQQVTGRNPSWFSAQGDGNAKVAKVDTSQFPVENVTWFDSIEFANRLSQREGRPLYYQLAGEQREGDKIISATVTVAGGDGYRLLTEAEWEYVARAGTATAFPWGDSLSPQQANFDVGVQYRFPFSAQEQSFQRPVPVGFYAPSPWGLYDTAGNVWEWVGDWYGADEYQRHASDVAVDPQGPMQGVDRVLRGGSWSSNSKNCRPARRSMNRPSNSNDYTGFRPALDST